MGNINSCVKSLGWWLKVIEFILALLIMLAWGAYPIIVFTTFTFAYLCCGYWLIFLGFILTLIFDDDHLFLEKYFCIAGCIVFLWVFVVALVSMFIGHGASFYTANIVMVILTGIECGILIFDTILQFRK